MYVCVCACARVTEYTCYRAQMVSENSLQELVLTLFHVSSRDEAQVIQTWQEAPLPVNPYHHPWFGVGSCHDTRVGQRTT